MWETVGKNVAAGGYRGYPRLVGETGGKDFILAHPSADAEAVATAIVRGSFEYQGQKCSAASRLYIPSNLWPEVKERLVADVETIKMGDPADFENFMGAVIDASAFKTHADAIAEAKAAGAEIVTGGSTDDSEGYFVQPTVIETDDKGFRLLRDELFGPIVTTYVYDEKRWDDTLELVDETAPYALTGAVFATERAADRGRARQASLRGRELLRQRQADRRGRRSAAVRRLARERDERQGRLDVEPHPLGDAAHGEGDLRAADRLPVPVPGAGLGREELSTRRVDAATAVAKATALQGSSRERNLALASSARCDQMLVRILDGIDAFLDQLGSVDFLPLALAIGCHLLKIACTSRAWRNVLAAAYPESRVPWISIYGAYLAGVGINAIIPARAGDAVRIVLAHRAIPGSTYTTVVSSTLVLSFFDMFAASLFLAWAVSIGLLPGLDVLSQLESFDFAWLFARPLLFDLVDRDDARRHRRRRVLDRGPRRGLPRARSRRRSASCRRRPATSDASRSGRPPTGGSGSSRSGSCSTRSTSRRRSQNAGLVQVSTSVSHALPDHAGRRRHGAGVPPLRPERRRLGVGAARVQRRREAHDHDHERRRRLHRDRADAPDRPLQEGARATAEATADAA